MTTVSRALGAILCAGATLGGCASYSLEGRVIPGESSFVAIVDSSDTRLDTRGVSNVEIQLWTDPERPNRELIASTMSGPDGSFSIPVQEVGAGFLQYDVALVARASGYAITEHAFRLPSNSRRALVIMRPGTPGQMPEGSLFDQYRQYSR